MLRSLRTTRLTICALSAMLVLSGCQAPAGETTNPAAAQAVLPDCQDDQQPLSKRMSSGATWSMCWSVDPKLGMVLSDIDFAPPGEEPIPVVSSMSLAQLEVPYDSGVRNTSDITSAGFGGPNMHTLTAEECAGDLHSIKIPNIGDGSKYGSSPEREVLCDETIDAGLSYRSFEQGKLLTKRREDWRLSTTSKVGWYEYINQVTFGADGSIRPALGATGDLSPVDYSDHKHGSAVGKGDDGHATSHSHNAVWKIDWALGGQSGQKVEQYDAKETGKRGEVAPLVEGRLTPIESPATAKDADRRWWRVLAPGVKNTDEHSISYQIELEHTDSFTFIDDLDFHGEGKHKPGSDIGYDVAFTNAKECEKFATLNREPGGCGRGVLDYVADSKDEPLDDVVSWVAVGFHHVPRDEEQSPMELHWQGFTMLPRDLSAQRIDPPEEREELNGQPTEWEGEVLPQE